MLTLVEIKNIIEPIAKKHGLHAVYIFGSFATGSADATSDVDILVDTKGSTLISLFKLGELYADLEEALKLPIDLITVDSLNQQTSSSCQRSFREQVWAQKVVVYEAA